MLNFPFVHLIVFVAALCCIPRLFAESEYRALLASAELLNALQSGGYIIYMRHAMTDHTEKDENRDQLEDCHGQRNLSPEGRRQAKQIGRAVKTLKIPISDVLSSPYCRCKDTARLVFGQYTIEPDLSFSISKDQQESQRLGGRLVDMMVEANVEVGNAVFVGHTSNLRDGLGIWPKPEGAVVVFKRRGRELIFIGMIKPGEWPGS